MNVEFSKARLSLSLILFFVFQGYGLAQSTVNASPSNAECLKCHTDHRYADKYDSSVHQSLKCTACHVKSDAKGIQPRATDSKTCVISFKPTDCASCHSSISKEHAGSVHNSDRLPVGCAQCHNEIHDLRSIKNDKEASAKLCSQCHEKQLPYFSSIHFQAIKMGVVEAPTCIDCHGLHAIDRIDNVQQGRIFHTQACLKCHSNTELMERNHITTIAPKTYFESYHGKNVRLGYPEGVAGCSDCHGAHEILPKKDTNSMINPAHLTNTCRQCHKNASDGFALYMPHADPTNKSANPMLFWVTIGMNALLAGTFVFFWVHSLLWVFRGFVEKKQQNNALMFSGLPVGSQHEHINHKVYRRFRPLHIFLHLFVISSFLGLAITGLPLKFNATSWGKSIMDFVGGVPVAGVIHRIAAIVTFGYFFVTLGMSIRFLFKGRAPKETMMQRLFGPDSLFPNRKDVRDIIAMFKWFFFRGPKPRFERWTYWEKFDFLAVFWGVTVIGSSGLILWFPEFFGSFLPGWVFNVATIIHSDEALLAVGFIFTIHFFNTHLRVEKFPMDFVIFNGQLSEEEMVTERSDQWQRYQDQGITEQFELKKATPISWEIFLRLFGLSALIVGSVLAVLILLSIFGG